MRRLSATECEWNGRGSWIGPLVGAILLGSIQEVARVTISSAVNLLIVGVLLVAFVVIAPNGIVGLIQEFLRLATSRRQTVQVALVFLAAYCFLLGLLEILVSIPWMAQGAASPILAIAGGAVCVLGILLLASSYALLTLRYWAAWLAAVSLAASIAGAVLYLRLLPPENATLLIVSIVISAAGVCFLLLAEVRSVYRTRSADAATPRLQS